MWKLFLFLLISGIGPLATGCTVAGKLPEEMKEKRLISFAGYDWQVKHRAERAGPGNNFFESGPEAVWVDAAGQLHLKITYREGAWRCAEIISQDSFGYGTCTFTLAPVAASFDKNVVLGLFLWDSYASRHNHEVDIEFSQWGRNQAPNVQYVVQPEYAPGNKHQFYFNLQAAPSRHAFTWSERSLTFTSGLLTDKKISMPGNERVSWVRQGTAVPAPAREKVRLNLWLYKGVPPANGQEVEVVLTGFTFTLVQDSSK